MASNACCGGSLSTSVIRIHIKQLMAEDGAAEESSKQEHVREVRRISRQAH